MIHTLRVPAVSAALCSAALLTLPVPTRAATDALPAYGVGTIAQLRVLRPPAVPTEANVAGYTLPGDGGGGRFRFDPGSCAPDNRGTVIAPVPTPPCGRWIRIDPGNPSVKWFGARGDGVTYDTVAIQAAVDALPTWGTLVFPGGRYRIEADRGVTLKDNMRLDLTGAILVGSNVTGARCRIFTIEGRSNVAISGGTLMGSRSGLPDWGVGIYASDALNLIVENTWFRDFYYDGILLTGDQGCRNVVVRGCVLWNNRRTGLAIVSASNVTVESSTFSGTAGQEPQAGVNCEPNRDQQVRNVRFTGCRFAGNAGVGLYVHRGLGTAVAGMVVERSVIEKNAVGIVAAGVQGVTITANRVVGHLGPRRFGISLGPGTAQALVSGNLVESNFRGILSSGATGVQILGNTVVGTGPTDAAAAVGSDGIACLGTDRMLAGACVVANNVVRRPSANGIVTWLVSNVQVLNNSIQDAGHRSIHLRSTATSEVRGNNLSGSGREPPPARYDAIELEEASNLNRVISNVIHFSGGMRSPISVAPDCKGNWVLANEVRY
jgi:parallel beta-helix repeat protein